MTTSIWTNGIATARRIGASIGHNETITRYAGPAISLGILASAMIELRTMDWHAVLALVPANPLFWIVFVIAYATPIIADWLIYRSIWPIPRSAVVSMIRKMVGNDLLIGYAGEAYLYAWARREGKASGAAFCAVKDVSILSAAVGGAMTILVALLTAPMLGRLNLDMPGWAIVGVAAMIAAPPAAALLFRKRLFHLATSLLVRIAAIHAVRATIGIILTAVLWHLALPGLALTWWLVFSAMKLLLSRLPLVSNRELVFAGAVAVMLGRSAEVAALMTMMATITVAAHVLVGLASSASEIIERIAVRLVPGLASNFSPVPASAAR